MWERDDDYRIEGLVEGDDDGLAEGEADGSSAGLLLGEADGEADRLLEGDDDRLLEALTGGQNDEEGLEYRELRTLLAFTLGMEGGPEGESMSRDVFRVVLDMLLPAWDPLRRGVPGMELPVSD